MVHNIVRGSNNTIVVSDSGPAKKSVVDTKARILEQSSKLFAEKGFDATGIDQIAKERMLDLQVELGAMLFWGGEG